MSMITFSDNKAGMAGLDKGKIQKIIDDSSGENYSAYAKKKTERLEKQKNEIRARVACMSEQTKRRHEYEMREICRLLEMDRCFDRHCVHIDMDAFYAAVEMRDEPKLRNIPMAVGGSSMLSTSNYAARQFGVRAAMPGFIALRLCPQLIIVPPNFDKYTRESRVLSAILAEYDPDLSMGSLDEAYLDLTFFLQSRVQPARVRRVRYSGDCACRLPLLTESDLRGLADVCETRECCLKCSKNRIRHEDELEFGVTRAEVVREIRFRVEQATGLTCSAGIAPNFMLAKVCSDQNKPNGQFELKNRLEDVVEFLRELPTRKVAGIGRVSEAHLSALGIEKVGQIVALAHLLPCAFSSLGVESMLRVGLGLGASAHFRDAVDNARKSISTERTFAPTRDALMLTHMLRELSETLCEQASAKVEGASGLSLKAKLSSFDVLTRSVSVPIGADLLNASTVFSLSKVVLDNLLAEGKELRLLGVRLYKLVEIGSGREERRGTVVDMLKKKRVCTREEEKEEEQKKRKERKEEREEGREEDTKGEGEEHAAKCPLCRSSLSGMDDRSMNMHVDECLNKDSIKDLLLSDYERRDQSTGHSVLKKRSSKAETKTLLNFFPKSQSG